jgi:DNA-binding NtrC family response regulator
MTARSAAKAARPRYVLIIEDNVHHAELLTEMLDRHFAPVVIHTVDTVKDGIDFAGQSNYDLILTGAVIREAPVTESIPRLAKLARGAPIVVISGRGDERLAAELIKRGATEYLVKSRETLEALPSILGVLLKSQGRARKPRSQSAQSISALQRLPSPSAIVREVDKLTQQALAIVGPRRRKRGGPLRNVEQLDQLLGQIRRLREMAAKLLPKDKD